MNKCKAFISIPLQYGKVCQIIPPKVKDVVGNRHFAQFQKILTCTQEEVEYELKDQLDGAVPPSPFEFLLINCYYNKQIEALTKAAFQFFCGEEALFNYEQKQIIFESSSENNRIIDMENFFDIQNLIREACGTKPIKPPEPIDPNEDPRIRRIKMKARERDAIKARKGVQGQGISLFAIMNSICCMGIGITPLNIGEMSYASLFTLVSTYQTKEKYDLDVQALLAGADSKKIKPKYWIKESD